MSDSATTAEDAPVPVRAHSRATLTACIIARDEAELLPECLRRLAFCDELIVVDSGSRDATVALARQGGARVVEQLWMGFPAQRNVALDHATGTWVIEVDADERVSSDLRAEIEAFVADPPPGTDIAAMPVRNFFLGRPLQRSAKYPQYSHRLFRRGTYRHDEARTVHEGLVPRGTVHPFESDLEHLLASSWREAIADAWTYARLEARQMQAPRTPGAFLRGALLRPLVKLVYRLTIDAGWRDGWRGAARIAIECAIDTVVWIRHLFAVDHPTSTGSAVPTGAHYADRHFHVGSVRILGVAFGASSCGRAVEWLTRAREDGADVALVAGRDARVAAWAADGRSPTAAAPSHSRQARAEPIRVRELDGWGPSALIHGLDAEEQLRTLDAVIPFGRRARWLMRLAPRQLRGALEGVGAACEPAGVLRRGLALRPSEIGAP